MIEQHRRSLGSSAPLDLDVLQRRANRQRTRLSSSQAMHSRLHEARATFAPSANPLQRIPTRYLLHTVIALMLPVAVLLSNVPSNVLLPQQSETQQSAPVSGGDFVVPMQPLELHADHPVVGDAPLEDNGDIPMPMSLTSKTDALAPPVVSSSIVGDRVFLRNGPGTQYDAVERIDGGTPIQVIGRYNDWFQVREQAGKQTYWISGELLNLPETAVYTLFEVQENAIPAPPPPKVGTVAEEGLQLRDGPGTNYVPMSKLSANSQLDLLEVYQDWYHVGVPGGADGWVRSDFMNVDPSVAKRLLVAETIPDANPAMVGVVNDNKVNLRKGPDSKYDRVTTLNSGERLDIIGKYEDWFKVRLGNGSNAWVFSDFFNVTERVLRRVQITKDFPALPQPAAVVARSTKSTTASSSSRTTSAGNAAASIPASGDVAGFAAQFVGSRYVWGGASPRGFDCSGLTMYVYSKFGVSLPHSAAAQYRSGARVSWDNLAAGDLVFFAGTGGGKGITHVALYLGGGRIVHAMTPRYGVQVSNINESYWVNHFYGASRIRR